MIETAFRIYSKPIGDAYKAFIEDYFGDFSESGAVLCKLYKEYASLDSNFPRPILTFLGVNATSKDLQDISHFEDVRLLLVPQLIRDFLAIHDDIIDEDLIKFNSDSLPYAYSKVIEPNSMSMNKWGKDVALLFGDMQLSAPISIISSLNTNSVTKQELFKLVSQVLYTTNKWQLEELLFGNVPLKDISSKNLSVMYKNKAADYCYAFPLTLGMIYSHIDVSIIKEMRSIMLDIGLYSQIINDIEGVFFEYFSNERNTLSDLTQLRRTYLLVRLYHQTTNPEVLALLNQTQLSEEQASTIKDAMIKSNVIKDVSAEIENACSEIIRRIKILDVGIVLKDYLLGLVNNRILANIRII